MRPNLAVSLLLTSFAFGAIPASADLLYATRYDGTVTQIDTATDAATTYVSGLNGGAGGLAFDKSGNLYVTDYGDDSVVRFTPNRVGTVFASDLNNPAGLAVDAAGNLYVASYIKGGGVIERFTPNGLGTVFASGLNGPINLVFDEAGNLYVANYYSGTVERITPDGVSTLFASGLKGPVGLAFDSSGNLYVSTDSDRNDQTITRYTPEGVGSLFSNTTPYYPTGLAFDGSGNLYAAHDGDGLVSQISPNGSQTTFSTSASDTISFLATQPVAVPEPSGTVLLLIGAASLICDNYVQRHRKSRLTIWTAPVCTTLAERTCRAQPML
jgi:sugar lactone lactonase YvrE